MNLFNSVGSRILYELDYQKPVLYVILIQNILGKMPVVPVCDTGTISHHLRYLAGGTSCEVAQVVCQATASRVPAMDARCGLSTCGHWDGPVICNEMGKGICVSVVQHGKRIKVIAILLLIDTIIANKEINGNNALIKRIIAII